MMILVFLCFIHYFSVGNISLNGNRLWLDHLSTVNENRICNLVRNQHYLIKTKLIRSCVLVQNSTNTRGLLIENTNLSIFHSIFA